MCCGCDTSYIVSDHIQCQASIYTLSLCRGHSWQVRLAKQETLTPPGHLVSLLVCRGPCMSIMVLYCWCHSDSASVLLYFTLLSLQMKKDRWTDKVSILRVACMWCSGPNNTCFTVHRHTANTWSHMSNCLLTSPHCCWHHHRWTLLAYCTHTCTG